MAASNTRFTQSSLVNQKIPLTVITVSTANRILIPANLAYTRTALRSRGRPVIMTVKAKGPSATASTECRRRAAT